MIPLIMEGWNLVNEAGYAQCCRLFLCTLCLTHTHMHTHTPTQLTAREVCGVCKTSSHTNQWQSSFPELLASHEPG